MLDIIWTRKENTRVFLFFKFYKMVLIIFKSERTYGARELPSFWLYYKFTNKRILKILNMETNDAYPTSSW